VLFGVGACLLEDLLPQLEPVLLAFLDDLACLVLGRVEHLVMPRQQVFAVAPRLLRALDRVADALLARIERLLQRAPGHDPQDDEQQHERHDRPDHEAGIDVQEPRMGTGGAFRAAFLSPGRRRTVRDERQRRHVPGGRDAANGPPRRVPQRTSECAPGSQAPAHLFWIMKQMGQAKSATPSMSAAVRIMLPRISFAASGWRAMLSTADAASRPMPIPAPITARPAPMP